MRSGNYLALISALIMSLGLPFTARAKDSVDPVFAPKAGPVDFMQANIFQDSRFFTMAADSSQVGPVFPSRTGDQALTQDYVTKVFRHIVVKADQMAHDNTILGYRVGANNQGYFTFLVLALTVPQHESRLIHFRESEGKVCSDQANNLLNQPPSSRRVLGAIYRDPLTPLFPDCRFFSKDEKVNQLLSSPTGDTGIMQVNARYHAPAFEPVMLMNVYRSIDYGIQYVWDGFEEINSNQKRFKCDFTSNPYNPFSEMKGSKASRQWNLIRATWAGRYNSRSVCRYMTKNENDVNFQKNLASLVRDDSSMFHRYLPEGSLERKTFLEIIANFRLSFSTEKIKEQTDSLNELLVQKEEIGKWQSPGRMQQDPTHFLRKGRVSLQAVANDRVASNCGYIKSLGEGAEKVQVFLMITDKFGQQWSEITVPPYATFVTFEESASTQGQCGAHDHYFVHTADLKRLNITFEPGHRYRAVIIGVGHSKTNIHMGPSVNSTIVDVFQPGRRIEITKTLALKNGEEWCEIVPGDASYSEAWVRCDKRRVAPVSEIKPGQGA